jgi:hypothetical protein
MPRARSQRASQKPSRRFERNGNAVNRMSGLLGFGTPAMQPGKQHLRIGILFPQRIATDAGNAAGDQPAR